MVPFLVAVCGISWPSLPKLAKINQERVYVNRFLPPDLQYGILHVDVKPLPGQAGWIAPRTFVFNDQTPAEMFLLSFPELLAVPSRQGPATDPGADWRKETG